MAFKKCPVCGNYGRAWNKKTCGAPECVKEWKTWGARGKMQGLQIADMEPTEYLEYLKSIGITQETEIEENSNLDVEDQKAIAGTGKSDIPQSLIDNLGTPKETDESNKLEPPVLSEQEQREIRRKQMLESLPKTEADDKKEVL